MRIHSSYDQTDMNKACMNIHTYIQAHTHTYTLCAREYTHSYTTFCCILCVYVCVYLCAKAMLDFCVCVCVYVHIHTNIPSNPSRNTFMSICMHVHACMCMMCMYAEICMLSVYVNRMTQLFILHFQNKMSHSTRIHGRMYDFTSLNQTQKAWPYKLLKPCMIMAHGLTNPSEPFRRIMHVSHCFSYWGSKYTQHASIHTHAYIVIYFSMQQ